jgi:hypothetical protein
VSALHRHLRPPPHARPARPTAIERRLGVAAAVDASHRSRCTRVAAASPRDGNDSTTTNNSPASLLKAAAVLAEAQEQEEQQLQRAAMSADADSAAAAARPSRLGKLLQNVNVAGTALFFRILLVSSFCV